MKRFDLGLCLLFLSCVPAFADGPSTAAMKACTSGEKWVFGEEIPKDFRREFDAFVGTKTSPARGFAEALALRRHAVAPGARKFSEYWIARTFYLSNILHSALSAFEAVVGASPEESTLGAQFAALECLNQIHGKNRALQSTAVSVTTLRQFLSVAVRPADKETIWKYALSLYVAEQKPEVLEILRGAGALENLARGLYAAKNLNYLETIRNLEAFLSNPKLQQENIEHIHLLLARAYYSTSQYEKAFFQLKQVSKSSNELAEALSELSWSALMAGKYREAVGTALSLQVGGLKHAFVPETLMVMAMSMNEYCQYPGALDSINTFRMAYEPSYRWLSAWSKDRKSADLYRKAISFLQKKSDVPDKVGTEWIRSPLFILTQGEINLISDEKDSLISFGQAAAKEQKQLGIEIRFLGSELKEKVRVEKAKSFRGLASGQTLSSELLAQLATFKNKVVHYRRFRLAANPWRSIAGNQRVKISAIVPKLLARIEADLVQRSDRMLQQLIEIAENNQLIEIEIYNGASQDIIWQNAHPDYKEIAKQMTESQGRGADSKNLNWGSTGKAEDAEVWEDELGSYFAKVFDNCNSKDRFLAVKGKNR